MIKELFKSKEGTPIIKTELDLLNVAEYNNGGKVFIDGVERPDLSCIIDGNPSHLNEIGEINVGSSITETFEDNFNSFPSSDDWYETSGNGSKNVDDGWLIVKPTDGAEDGWWNFYRKQEIDPNTDIVRIVRARVQLAQFFENSTVALSWEDNWFEGTNSYGDIGIRLQGVAGSIKFKYKTYGDWIDFYTESYNVSDIYDLEIRLTYLGETEGNYEYKLNIKVIKNDELVKEKEVSFSRAEQIGLLRSCFCNYSPTGYTSEMRWDFFYELNQVSGKDVVIKFNKKRKINRVELFCYPKNTLVEPDATANAPESYLIQYATNQELSNWENWIGLEDRSEEVGQSPTTITDGLVSENVNTYNVFHDTDGVEAYAVKFIFYDVAVLKIVEVRIWHSIEFQEFSRLTLKADRDIITGKFKASTGAGTLIAEGNEYYPQKGVFSELKENDITKMRMRVYGGLKKGGVDYWDIIGHYYVYDWTIFVNRKK